MKETSEELHNFSIGINIFGPNLTNGKNKAEKNLQLFASFVACVAAQGGLGRGKGREGPSLTLPPPQSPLGRYAGYVFRKFKFKKNVACF